MHNSNDIIDSFLNQERGRCEAEKVAAIVSQSNLIDENYMTMGTHLDKTMVDKIIAGEYIDFGKLLPRDKIIIQEDHRMEIVTKGGLTYFTPVVDREVSMINSFSHWEQAFRTYSNVYSRRYPHRATELIQYNHIIHTASLTYTWDNVYMYDKEFCMHLSSYPYQSWSVILQHAGLCISKTDTKRNVILTQAQNLPQVG